MTDVSARIERIRLWLILGVVAIHCNVDVVPGYDGGAVVAKLLRIYCSALPDMCVPAFFIISAYLVGTRYKRLTLTDYKTLLRRRTRTLLVPYLLWNIIEFFVREAVNLSPLGAYTSGGYEYESPVKLLYFIFLQPNLEPLWFIRNLICFLLLLPVLYFLLRKLRFAGVVLLFIADALWDLSGISYFFCGLYAGACLSETKLNGALAHCAWLLPLFVAVSVGLTFVAQPDIVRAFTIPLLALTGTAGLLGASGCRFFLRQPKIPRGAIFFLYAFHGIIAAYVMKTLGLLFHPHDYGWLAIYLLSFLLVCLLTALVYKLTDRYLPSLLRLLTGGRPQLNLTAPR